MTGGFYIAYPTPTPTPHRAPDEGQTVMLFDTRAEAQAHADTLEVLCDVCRTTRAVRELVEDDRREAAEWRADAMETLTDLADREEMDLVDDDSAEVPQQ